MNTKKAMEIKRRKTPTAPELFLQAVSAYPCIFYWSDGSQSKTTINAFNSEDDYNRYLDYKLSGKPYPVKIEAVPPTEPSGASNGITHKTAQDDYEVISHIAESLTKALTRFYAEGKKICKHTL